MKSPSAITTLVFLVYAALIGGCVLILSGCINDRFAPLRQPQPISFESSIGEPSREVRDTRAENARWHPADAIGVYMVEAGGTLADNSLDINVEHRHVGSGNFTASPGLELYYPRIGKVDFVAYYPWRPTYDDHRYPVDVSDQSDPAAIDFIYSDNASGHSAGDVPMLEFHHRLSKLLFDVTDLTGAPLDNLSAVVTGLSTRGVFHLSEGRLSVEAGSGAGIALAFVDDGDDDAATANLEAIVLPEAEIAPVVDFTLPDGATARLRLTDEAWLEGKIYIHNVAITAPGGVVLTDGSVIVDWDDQNRAPEEHRIPKTNPNNPDNPDNPDNPNNPDNPGNSKIQYFSETFGTVGSGLATYPKIDAYTGWDSRAPVTFADALEGADVRSHGSLDAHIWFPPAVDADLKITGLPSGYSDITLSYDIASAVGGATANCIKVFADGQNMTSQAVKTIPSPNRYVTISMELPAGVTSLRFVSDGTVNTHGIRIDNIRLKGVEN